MAQQEVVAYLAQLAAYLVAVEAAGVGWCTGGIRICAR